MDTTTSTPVVTVLGDRDADEVIAYVVAAQRDPLRHIAYTGTTPVAVAGDLSSVEDWRARTFVARDPAGTLRGVLVADVAPERGRVWWLGPWVDTARADASATATSLLAAADQALGELVTQEEFGPDSRNHAVAEWALARGCRVEEASAVLVCDLTAWAPEGTASSAHVRPLEHDDHDVVARIHDRLFPGAHTLGRELVADEETTMLVIGDDPVGYVTTQVQADGTGYIDFLGVDVGSRGRGFGRALVSAAMTDLAHRDVPEAGLSVRVGNQVARALYASLGFEEERVITPHRRGFTLDRR